MGGGWIKKKKKKRSNEQIIKKVVIYQFYVHWHIEAGLMTGSCDNNEAYNTKMVFVSESIPPLGRLARAACETFPLFG